MINSKEIEILQSAAARQVLKDSQNLKPADFALKNANLPHLALLATQLKLRQKAAAKLPGWLQAGCLFADPSLEQATSEIAASLKNPGSGALAIDLTCGLGVDTALLAHHFTRVIALEADEGLCTLARFNFAQLGLLNIDVVHGNAENWVLQHPEIIAAADLIYLDPARRESASGKRLYDLSACSPDFFAIYPALHPCKRILLKTSPMFDFREGLRRIPETAAVTAITVNSEVKEILYEIHPGFSEKPQLRVAAWLNNRAWHFECSETIPSIEAGELPAERVYLYEPDAGFYLFSIAHTLVQQQYSELSLATLKGTAWFFSTRLQPDFPGHVYLLMENLPWKPSQLKKIFKEKGITHLNLRKRDSNLSLPEAEKTLGIRPGGDLFLLLSGPVNQCVALLAQKIR